MAECKECNYLDLGCIGHCDSLVFPYELDEKCVTLTYQRDTNFKYSYQIKANNDGQHIIDGDMFRENEQALFTLKDDDNNPIILTIDDCDYNYFLLEINPKISV